MSTPLNQNEGTRIPNPQVLDHDISQLKTELSTSFHNLEPSMGQEPLKAVPKLKEWPHFSDFELPDRLVTARFNTLFTRSAHRWYIKLTQAHGHQSWTWWKTQIINKWANDAWRFKVETAFESARFNADKDKALPWFFQQKDRLTALYPEMSEFMIHRKILRQCGGDLEHAVKSRTTEQSSAEDIINILEQVTTRTKIGSSRVNLKASFNRPWKVSVDKNPKENSNHIKYKPADIIRKCHIFQSTTHLANTCPIKGKINEIDIEKGPDVEKDNNIEGNSDDKRPAYPSTPKSREAPEIHLKELLDVDLIRKVGHNEEVEITTSIIVAWHNGKSRMVGDFRSLNTYTVPDRYPISKIQIALTQISQAVYISTMDALKGFYQNVVTPRARKYLRIIVHCGVYEYLRMPFGIKNAPSHFQKMINKIFPEELSEGWLIIYIDDIIVCSKAWEEHMYRLSRFLTKIQSVNMKISLNKCHFGFKELKALGHVVSGSSLGIDKNKVAAVLLKPMSQNKKFSHFWGLQDITGNILKILHP
ncbi:hypothetical protein O181_090347 [Austropuccinia psidii MF-1]|uniref:Reverse transcriptase domain-containing protein n=1 Tax=Austropuccinia psidii MF-1 TaxID=1389203 RepID=A0A9Q3IV70_9BASI|nr:hypothetical protein [Austropuccinia psidii MF-1]